MSPDEKLESPKIIAPVRGGLTLTEGRIRVKVFVGRDSKVSDVRAEAYQDVAPENLQYSLQPGNDPGVYEGTIPGFLGRFSIRAIVIYEGRPQGESRLRLDGGPYRGRGGYVDDVDILEPAPDLYPGAYVTLGMGAEFFVRVKAHGDIGVTEVHAEAYQTTAPATPAGPLIEDTANPGEYTGYITGFLGTFRIKARAEFEDGTGDTDPGYDDKGYYYGVEKHRWRPDRQE